MLLLRLLLQSSPSLCATSAADSSGRKLGKDAKKRQGWHCRSSSSSSSSSKRHAHQQAVSQSLGVQSKWGSLGLLR
jgi:hypothetical protein